jgi:hypothetical protein
MRCRIVGLALLLVLGGCGEGTNGPPGPILLGQWGVAGESPARLTGLHVAAELQLPCSSIGTNQPVELDSDGHFAFEGRLHTSQLTRDDRTAQVTGELHEDRVTLTIDVPGDSDAPHSLILDAGVDPGFDARPPMCPL